jgi:hypothetical protein
MTFRAQHDSKGNQKSPIIIIKINETGTDVAPHILITLQLATTFALRNALEVEVKEFSLTATSIVLFLSMVVSSKGTRRVGSHRKLVERTAHTPTSCMTTSQS